MHIRPPSVALSWDETDVWSQALLIAYSQIRDYEEQEKDNEMAKCMVGRL